jgi:formylglycine-generating enzyme required for sulfatase activity
VGVVAALLLAGVAGLWAGGVFRLRTAEGILVVEVNEKNPDVYVDGERMTVTWGEGGKSAIIRVRPGTHKVEVKKDGFTVFGEEVELKDGDHHILTARLVSQAPRPVMKERPPLLKAPFSKRRAKELQRAWAKYLGRQVEEEVDLRGGVKMQFVLIPPGSFTMGSPPGEEERVDNEAAHEVTITRPFYLGKYAVTQAQYQQVVGKNPSDFSAGGGSSVKVQGLDTGRFPVETVSWEDATAFCQKLAERTGRKAGLPSEAEWEYACRAGTTTPFHFGTALDSFQANCDGKFPYPNGIKGGPYLGRTCSVGSYPPNAFGLYDMHGNVWQWCQDWYAKSCDDLSGSNAIRVNKSSEDARVLRGGSWVTRAGECRAARRLDRAPAYRDAYGGFRVAFRLD